ncbi:MAG: Na+/H+ antiporter NhaA [Bacteroidetes bacterium]|nr:Na+/H+ antiporter NhaA [Bacteroidota bacterium]
MALPRLFQEFFQSKKAGGLVLIFCTAVSLILANSPVQNVWLDFWHREFAGNSIVHWINDGMMAIFFLLIGLELEREIYTGELSSLKSASLPFFGAFGGMLLPAGIFLLFNYGAPTQSGAGIPMATDIAFAIGILSLLGTRIPDSLKIFLTALAVIDDLGAILIIAVFYTKTLVISNLFISLAIFAALVGLNRLKVYNLLPYLLGGVAMWYFMLHSGIHATVAGVLLAFAIPFGDGGAKSPSYIMQHVLHKPVDFIILPLFALANTSLILGAGWYLGLGEPLTLGIILGLFIGKPLGIVLFSLLGVALGLCSLPAGSGWKHLVGVGFLGGIGFTMSIFITLLAFDQHSLVNSSKIAILLASFAAGIAGYFWLKSASVKNRND